MWVLIPCGGAGESVGISTSVPQDLGLAVREGSPLRERLNRAILSLTENGQINRLHVKWFGESKR